jgi:hypothetical protein
MEHSYRDRDDANVTFCHNLSRSKIEIAVSVTTYTFKLLPLAKVAHCQVTEADMDILEEYNNPSAKFPRSRAQFLVIISQSNTLWTYIILKRSEDSNLQIPAPNPIF